MQTLPRSLFLDIDGPVHVADYGGDAAAGTVVCLHGLGNSHVSWRRFAAQLTPHHRVVAVDLPGHGRSPRQGRSAGVLANLEVFGRVLEQVATEPVYLVGHSMGATVAALHAASRPDTISALALLAPPMPRSRGEVPSVALAARVALCAWPWLAHRTLSRQLERLGAEEYVERGLRLTCESIDDIDITTRQLLVELVESRAAGEDAQAAFVEAARSIGLLVARAGRYREALADITTPGLVVHGSRDRLLSTSSLQQIERLQPGWATHVLEGVGHSPHLEAPERTALVVEHFLRDVAHAPRLTLAGSSSQDTTWADRGTLVG